MVTERCVIITVLNEGLLDVLRSAPLEKDHRKSVTLTGINAMGSESVEKTDRRKM